MWDALKQHIGFQLSKSDFTPHSKDTLKTFKSVLMTMEALENNWI